MNRQALTEALNRVDGLYPRPDQFLLIEEAARLVERLLPGEHDRCKGYGVLRNEAVDGVAPLCDCHGGQVWDEEIYQAVVRAVVHEEKVHGSQMVAAMARAVLASLAALAESQPFPPAGR